MTPAICIPWMGGDEHRERAFAWCRDWWCETGFKVAVGTGKSRSAARNDAAREAISDGADVLFFADADTFCQPEAMLHACRVALDQQRFVTAFSTFHRLDRARTQKFQTWPPRPRLWEELKGPTVSSRFAVGGLVAIPVELWNVIGGYDERFTGWGFEDRAIWFAARTLGSPSFHCPGRAYHWWHPSPLNRTAARIDLLPGYELGMRYKVAAGHRPRAGILPELRKPAEIDREAMLAILSEPGGPLAT